ncbi:MAG: TIGR04076 family protein [Bacteroidaceae bacterium]|nr:TIGR04076 family protein [Bacteroidaceae bacterium]
MNKVRITAMRQTVYEDLMAQYENAIEHACDVRVGQQWISEDGRRPEGLCPSAWESMQPFVESLAHGEGNFFADREVAEDGTVIYRNGWMQNPMSAMISCNDGFRPVSFYLEVVAE